MKSVEERHHNGYTHSNSSVKGKPNMTALKFCNWVNVTLLPSSTLPKKLKKE